MQQKLEKLVIKEPSKNTFVHTIRGKEYTSTIYTWKTTFKATPLMVRIQCTDALPQAGFLTLKATIESGTYDVSHVPIIQNAIRTLFLQKIVPDMYYWNHLHITMKKSSFSENYKDLVSDLNCHTNLLNLRSNTYKYVGHERSDDQVTAMFTMPPIF